MIILGISFIVVYIGQSGVGFLVAGILMSLGAIGFAIWSYFSNKKMALLSAAAEIYENSMSNKVGVIRGSDVKMI